MTMGRHSLFLYSLSRRLLYCASRLLLCGSLRILRPRLFLPLKVYPPHLKVVFESIGSGKGGIEPLLVSFFPLLVRSRFPSMESILIKPSLGHLLDPLGYVVSLDSHHIIHLETK